MEIDITDTGRLTDLESAPQKHRKFVKKKNVHSLTNHKLKSV